MAACLTPFRNIVLHYISTSGHVNKIPQFILNFVLYFFAHIGQ